MDEVQIAQVRRFNRLVTLRTGALNDSYLGRGRPLGLARLLYEIGPDGAELGPLRERLGLDSGYMSRLMRALEAEGVAAVQEDPADRRRRGARLTPAGLAERAAYDTLSDDFARRLLAPLDAAQRDRLAAAMGEVERLLRVGSVIIAAEPAESEAARACLAAYFAELDQRFETGFNPAASGSAPAGQLADAGLFLLARLDGQPVGCGAVRPLDAEIAEIKRMWIAPEARGIGLARRLLAALEAEAAALGARRVRLDTNRALTEAQALYRKAGYREIARYNDNPYADFFFEKDISKAGRD